jgi:hypothetical protein
MFKAQARSRADGRRQVRLGRCLYRPVGERNHFLHARQVRRLPRPVLPVLGDGSLQPPVSRVQVVSDLFLIRASRSVDELLTQDGPGRALPMFEDVAR